jgi:hypothetical protein
MIKGNNNVNYARLEMSFKACVPNSAQTTCGNHTIEELKTYLIDPELIFLYNSQRFS